MKKNPDKCYFCGTPSQYDFFIKIPVCSKHWNMMYRIKTPKYLPNEQRLNYKKMTLIKKLKGYYDN